MLINTNEYTWRILMAVYTCIYIYTLYRPLPAWPEAGRAKTSRAAVFINMIKPISERNAHASLNVPWTCLIQIHVSAMEGQREREWERERKESHFTAQIEIVRLSFSLLAWISFRPLPTIDAGCMCLKIVYAQNYNVNLEDSLSSCLDVPW